jgi:hypothetical protein
MKIYEGNIKTDIQKIPFLFIEEGGAFERMNNIDSAKAYCDLANKGCETELVKHPNNVGIIEELISLKALTVGKGDAITEIDRQIK